MDLRLALVLAGGVAAAIGGLRFAARRLPVWLARHRGVAVAATPTLVALAFVAAELGLWLVGAWIALGAVPAARMLRGEWLHAAERALSMPLLALGARMVTARDLLAIPASLLALWLATGLATRVLAARLRRAAGGTRGAAETIPTLARYGLLVVGGFALLQAWGIEASSLAFVASLVGVGLGFGLQNITSNFVSGVLIGLERPIQPGDYVGVGEFTGTVERIGPRSTEIRTLDGLSILVPNARFLEHEVVNFTHRDPATRLHVAIGLDYGCDAEAVHAVLLEVARASADVLPDPRPEVQLTRFGDSAIEFELLVWTRDPRRQNTVRSSLHFAIDAALRRHGLRVPFPQHDVHLSAPVLERMLGDTLRRALGAEAVPDRARPAEVGVATAAPAPAPAADPRRDLPPAAWPDRVLDEVVAAMRRPGGVAVADRRHRLRTHARCFVGREAVDWLVARERLPRHEARELGQRLFARGDLRHVLDEHGFEDDFLFYRFREAAADHDVGQSPAHTRDPRPSPTLEAR